MRKHEGGEKKEDTIWGSREVPLRNHLNQDQRHQEPVRQKGRRGAFPVAGTAHAEALRQEGAWGLPGAEATGMTRGKLETDKDPVRWDPAAVPRSSGLSQGGRDRGRDLSGL